MLPGAGLSRAQPTQADAMHGESKDLGGVRFSPSATRGSVSRSATVEPLAPGRFRVQFTASTELRDKLERLQALMRSTVPGGDLAKVIDVAVTRELERVEARRFGRTKKPRKRLAQADTAASSRHIPAPVRRFVEQRDGGRCTFRDKHGRRCSERHDLEFHHVLPFGLGGDHAPESLVLMCRTHNALAAEQDFGKDTISRHRRETRERRAREGVRTGAPSGGDPHGEPLGVPPAWVPGGPPGRAPG